MTWPTKTDFVDGDVLTAVQVNNIGTNLNEADPTGITDGYVLTADGAGGMGWEAIPPSGGYTSITSGTFTSGNTTLTLSSIPATYKHLYLMVWDFQFTASSPLIYVRINNVTSGARYAWCQYGQTTTPALYSQAQVQNEFRIANGITAGNTLNFQMFIPNYTQALEDAYPVQWNYASDNNDVIIGAGRVRIIPAAAINRIDIVASTSTFAAGSYELFGVS